MLRDKVRTESFRRAIFETVQKGDVVLDLGCGTGILSYFSLQAGAEKVYAIETGNIIEIAKELAVKNGFQDRIVFIKDLSTRVDLPEKADVLVSEIIGNVGLEEGILEFIKDARERFLKPQGKMIPRSLEILAAPVELAKEYEKLSIWKEGLYGIDYSPVQRFAQNNLYSVSLHIENLLAPPALVAQMDLSETKASYLGSGVSFAVTRPGMLHGLGGWFRAELAKDLWITNQPPNRTPSWAHMFFPFETCIPVKEGDCINVSISTFNGDAWKWEVEVHEKADFSHGPAKYKAKMAQSSFFGEPLTKEMFKKFSSEYAPKLSRRGEAELFFLNHIDSKKKVGEIEAELLKRFPDFFRGSKDAAEFVREMAAKCS